MNTLRCANHIHLFQVASTCKDLPRQCLSIHPYKIHPHIYKQLEIWCPVNVVMAHHFIHGSSVFTQPYLKPSSISTILPPMHWHLPMPMHILRPQFYLDHQVFPTQHKHCHSVAYKSWSHPWTQLSATLLCGSSPLWRVERSVSLPAIDGMSNGLNGM